MKQIRTSRGKLYGVLDEQSYTLQIKNGRNIRLIPIPATGLWLQYISGAGTPETVYIPPRHIPAGQFN